MWREVTGLVDDTAARCAALAAGGPDPAGLRTVLLGGDVYVRLDDWASDGLARRLAERGLRVVVEPLCLLLEYLAIERSPDLAGLPTTGLSGALVRALMPRLRARLYRRVQARHPWLPMPDPAPMIAAARPIIDRVPRGEAPITVGSVLHNWERGVCDGVVVAGPWGCGPALASEGLLRGRTDIPMLFVYHDGSPIDERRLNAFAHRLRRLPART
jgi:predicted nucleotide-binding protein (sugar kinase/HSP70/actin superfamily)